MFDKEKLSEFIIIFAGVLAAALLLLLFLIKII